MNALAINAIGFYQQFISPHKGFRCARRARHGGRSCSEFAKHAVRKLGLLCLPPLLQRRFEKCARAAAALRNADADHPPGHVARRKQAKKEKSSGGANNTRSCCGDGAAESARLAVEGACELVGNAASSADVCPGADGCDFSV